MPVFALTIFIGAFLLFQVQPLIGKYILPWFGGGPGVWTTCMLFFQLLLLGGYAYAHFSSRHLKPKTQAVVHLILLAAALAMLPITPSAPWYPPLETAAGDGGTKNLGRRCTPAHLDAETALAWAAGVRVDHAGGGHEQALSGRGGDPVPVGAAAGAVPGVVHHLL